MLNKNDPLIGAVQEVMKKNQAEREAAKLVNEKFGVTDRKALPHERQGAWDAAYKTVLTEGVEALDEDWDPEKRNKAEKIEKGAKTIKGKGHIKDFGKLIADRTKNDAVTGLDSASGAKKAMKQLYGKNKGDSGAIKKISEEEALDEKKLVGNQPKIDVASSTGKKEPDGKLTKHDFEHLHSMKEGSDVTSPSSMGIPKPNYASGTPAYANKGPQMVNRAAKTSLPAGTVAKSIKEEEQIDEAGMMPRGTIAKKLLAMKAGMKSKQAEKRAYDDRGMMGPGPNFEKDVATMRRMDKVKARLQKEENLEEREMTSSEKTKEEKLKSKLDPSGMKASMQKQYGSEKGENVYFATIRKKAMKEDNEGFNNRHDSSVTASDENQVVAEQLNLDLKTSGLAGQRSVVSRSGNRMNMSNAAAERLRSNMIKDTSYTGMKNNMRTPADYVRQGLAAGTGQKPARFNDQGVRRPVAPAARPTTAQTKPVGKASASVNAATGSLTATDTQRRAGMSVTNVRDVAYGANPTAKKLGPASSTGGQGPSPVPTSAAVQPKISAAGMAANRQRLANAAQANRVGSAPMAPTPGSAQAATVAKVPPATPAPSTATTKAAPPIPKVKPTAPKVKPVAAAPSPVRKAAPQPSSTPAQRARANRRIERGNAAPGAKLQGLGVKTGTKIVQKPMAINKRLPGK